MDRGSLIDIFTQLFFALVLIAAFIAWVRLFSRRGLSILREWAANNHFELITYQERSAGGGPFKWWRNGRGQIIFSITVRDETGQERAGWVRCGSYLRGVFVKKVEVQWADEHEPAIQQISQ